MKKIILATFLLAMNVSASQYSGEETWNNCESCEFSPLQTAGIVFDAIEEAFVACQRDGQVLCAATQYGVNEDSLRYYSDAHQAYRRKVGATASVISLDAWVSSRAIEFTEIYEGSSSAHRRTHFGALDILGVRMMALNEALAACFANGNAFCALVSIASTRNNSPTYIDSEEINGYESAATAVVRGYQLRR